MVPSDVHAKFGSDLCRIEKVSGTPFFPRAGRQWPVGRRGASRGTPPHRPLLEPRASEIFKLARSRRKSVGSRPWSQVPCMTNLVRTGRELKKFLGLCKIFPGRGKAGRHAASQPPCPRAAGYSARRKMLQGKNLHYSTDTSQIWCAHWV